ncbi:MAG: hypothetical protein JWO60_2666 [Frankiales bacterium]|nr:hypothetical protein [Frankiales bacterium]
MRLLVDLQACQGPSAARGIGYYASSLARALHATRGEHEVLVLVDGEVPAHELLALRARLGLPRDSVVPFAAPAHDVRPRAAEDTEAAREAAIAALAPDVVLLSSVFELLPTAPVSIGRWCSNVPTAAVLYDLIPLTDLARHKAHPERRREYLAALEHLRAADLLLAISDHSGREAQRLLDPCPPVATVHGAARAPVVPVPPRRAPTGGFVLSVGFDEPRKDVPTAVRAFALLRPEVRAGRPFVVAGQWNEQEKAGLRAHATAAGLPDGELLFLGRVDDAELDWLYAHADLFVFPSLDEGLGLPPLEATRAGTPVVMAASSSLVELADHPAMFFPPGDVAALAARMAALLADDDLRKEVVASAQASAERFTWTATAERTWAALDQLRPRRVPVPARRRLLVVEPVTPLPEDVAAELGTAYEVTRRTAPPDDAWRYERVLYWTDGTQGLDPGWLVATPGVLGLRSVPVDLTPDPALLAPLLGAVAPDPQTAREVLRLGLTSAPALVPAQGWAAALEAVYATDVATVWAGAQTRQAHRAAVHQPLGRRTHHGRQPRGRLLGSDTTIYRTTAFLSGIQRTAARLHDALDTLLAPHGGAVVPVQLGATPEGLPHPVIARDAVLAAGTAEPADVDWVLCLDLNGHVMGATERLQQARAHGTGVVTNVFDLLPWSHPEWWPPGASSSTFVPWVDHALQVSDVLLVNSIATARDIEAFVAAHRPLRPDGFEVQLLRLGGDLAHAASSAGDREPDHFLMVGTVEPRKGHREALDAFEQLWRAGSTARLTVLGRAGWMVDDVVARMEVLAQTQPLFAWLKNAPDVELDRLYGTCTAVVLASEGEGFGLPVVEAAVRGCPVVVRDIPVLRELAGEGATYFTHDLAGVLGRVLREGAAVPSLENVHTWEQVGQRLLDVLDGHVVPLARWSPEQGWTWT